MTLAGLTSRWTTCAGVGGGEGAGDLGADPQRGLGWQWTGGQPLGQRAAGQQLHHDIGHTVAGLVGGSP